MSFPGSLEQKDPLTSERKFFPGLENYENFYLRSKGQVYVAIYMTIFLQMFCNFQFNQSLASHIVFFILMSSSQ